ncbi:hypothetical protein [uncultured Tateyamaria sp.]|uniref:hypothetical protein n=1 Tax=uncultured Tateyamaria sp. TaxID=455651 RepID=UPI002610A9FA|nr:hypothetical protein [uncultured Tateyamaria sp.]
MQKHDWLIEVCDELIQYAMNNRLQHFEDQLQRAIIAAKHDMLLAALGTSYDGEDNVVVLKPALTVHQRGMTLSDA